MTLLWWSELQVSSFIAVGIVFGSDFESFSSIHVDDVHLILI